MSSVLGPWGWGFRSWSRHIVPVGATCVGSVLGRDRNRDFYVCGVLRFLIILWCSHSYLRHSCSVRATLTTRLQIAYGSLKAAWFPLSLFFPGVTSCAVCRGGGRLLRGGDLLPVSSPRAVMEPRGSSLVCRLLCMTCSRSRACVTLCSFPSVTETLGFFPL